MSEALPFAFLKAQLQHGAPLNSTADTQNDSYGIIPCSQEEGNNGLSSQNVKCNGLDSYMGTKTGDKESFGGSMSNFQEAHSSQFVRQRSEIDLNSNKSPRICSGNGRVETMSKIQSRDIADGSCPKEYDLASSTEASRKLPLPPFEFYVSSEQGINLCVDLNSSPLDWIKSLKDEVNICGNVNSNKSQTLQQELGRFRDSNEEMKTSSFWKIDATQVINVQLTEENHELVVNHPNGGDGYVKSSEIPCDVAVNVSERLQEDQSHASSKSCSESRNQILSGAESFPRDGYKVTPDPNISDTPRMESACGPLVNSKLDGPFVASLEQPSPKLSDETCKNSTLPNGGSLVDASALYPRCSVSGSVEIQLSEAASYNTSSLPCKNGGLLELVNPKHDMEREKGALGNLSELDHKTCGNHLPTLSEEKERSNNINGMDSSEFSQFDKSFENNIVRSEDFGCNEEVSRKRLRTGGEYQSDCSQPDVRSRKHHAGELLPRRSMRLVTKVLFSLFRPRN